MRSGIECPYVDPIVALGFGDGRQLAGSGVRVALWIQGVERRGFIFVLCERQFEGAEKDYLARMKTDESGYHPEQSNGKLFRVGRSLRLLRNCFLDRFMAYA